MTYDLLILGAGAAGLMAAIAAAESAQSLTPPRALKSAILEKNARPGVKILVCGGGRCNLTNAGDQSFLIEQFGRNGRFLTPALQEFDNTALRAWFAAQGVPTHEEHDGKIYPNSNRAESVVTALVRRVHELGVEVFAGPGWAAAQVHNPNRDHQGAVTDRMDLAPIPLPDGRGSEKPHSPADPEPFTITTVDGHTFTAHNLLIAVGGQSYTRMGTTGDGYRFAAALGHKITPLRPAIVGLLCQEDWPKTLQGLAIQDVEVRIEVPGAGPLPKLTTGKPTPSINDLLFTHFGLSGPAVLNLSEIVAELLEKFDNPNRARQEAVNLPITLRVDFARHHTHDQLRRLFQNWQQRQGTKLIRKLLAQNTPEIIIHATSPDQTWSTPPMSPPSVKPAASDGEGPGTPTPIESPI
ncbi:MAG: NAD(P)/FAD-dependent oxidoreductase, partial [Phycisphaerae bacterium]